MIYAMIVIATTLQSAQPAGAPAVKTFDCNAPQYRQFDFWVGDWDVVSAAPSTAGGVNPQQPASNVVLRAHGGCVIVENWDDRQGGTGQSFNIYDRVTQRWHQTWVDNHGSLHQYWGEMQDGKMVFVGEVPLAPAARVQGRRTVRLSFIPMGPDKVRQFSETLNSDGTWSVNYDLIYTRRVKTK